MFSTIFLLLRISGIFLYEYINYSLFGNKIVLYKNLIKKISKLNIIFIKVIQWIVVDYGDEKLNEIITDMTNKVYYSEEDIDYKLIEDIEKYSNNELLIEKVPINSGTIALVFKGKLNNIDIVIKIIRKDTKKKLNDVMNFLNNILYILNKISFIDIENYSLNEILKYNMDNFLNQSNFIMEAENIQLFYNNYIDDEHITIPKVYMNYTKKFDNIIVMDYIKGKNLNNINSNSSDYVTKIYYFLQTSIYKYNIIHCDIHPGNIIFTDNNICIIDFGFVSKIDKEIGKYIFIFYEYYMSKKTKKLYKLIIEKLCKKKNENITISQEIIDKEYDNFLFFFNEGQFLEYNKILNHSDLLTLNEFFKKINLVLINDCINIITSLGPTLLLINFLLNKDSIKKFNMKDALNLLKNSNVPKDILIYD